MIPAAGESFGSSRETHLTAGGVCKSSNSSGQQEANSPANKLKPKLPSCSEIARLAAAATGQPEMMSGRPSLPEPLPVCFADDAGHAGARFENESQAGPRGSGPARRPRAGKAQKPLASLLDWFSPLIFTSVAPPAQSRRKLNYNDNNNSKRPPEVEPLRLKGGAAREKLQFFTYQPSQSHSDDNSSGTDTLAGRASGFVATASITIINNKQAKCERNSNDPVQIENFSNYNNNNNNNNNWSDSKWCPRQAGSRLQSRSRSQRARREPKASIKDAALALQTIEDYHEKNLANASNLKDESGLVRLKSFPAGGSLRVISGNPRGRVDKKLPSRPLIKGDALPASSCDNNDHYYSEKNTPEPSKWLQNNSTRRTRISMIDCNCIYTRASSESCNDNKRGSGECSNAISNGSGIAGDSFASLAGPEAERKLPGRRPRGRRRGRFDCHRKDRPLRQLNCWLLILILTFSFLSKGTDCGPEPGQLADGIDLNGGGGEEANGKHQLWLQLLGSLLAGELGNSEAGTGSGQGPALEHLTSRFASWPSQRRAGLFYLDLLERRRANRQLVEAQPWRSCRRVSLAELESERIPAQLIDNKTSSATLASPPGSSSDDASGEPGSGSGNAKAKGSREAEANWAEAQLSRMRAWAQLNEVSDSALLAKLNQEAKFADGAKLAVENANIISRLLIHPESQVIIGIASQQNFFKYLLESKLRQLVSSGSGSPATQLLHSAGLIFFDAYDDQDGPEPDGNGGGGASGELATDRNDAGEAYNDAPDRHLTLTPPASVATNNRNFNGGLAGLHETGPGRGGSLEGIRQAEPGRRNKLRSSFAPQAVLNYGTQSADDFSIKLYDLAKHPIAADANSPNGYFRPETAFLSRWLVAREQLELIELTERLNALLELPEKWADVGGNSKWRGGKPEEEEKAAEEDGKLSLKLADGRWFSPYFDCGISNRWLLTYSLPFFASSKTRNSNNTSNRNNKDKRTIRLRGASFVSLDLGRSRLVDQCAPAGAAAFLANTHQCARLHQSRCLRLAAFSEVRTGGYVCQCPGRASLAGSERQAVQAQREYLSELIIGNSINASRALDQLALADPEDRLADKAFVGKQLALCNQPDCSEQPPAATDSSSSARTSNNRQPAGRNKLINAPHFALGAQLELDSALEWFARAKPEEAQLERWPRQACRLCKSVNASELAGEEALSGNCQELPGDTFASWIRRLVLVLQSLCGLLTIALIAILLRVRKSRIILVSGWLMLETTLVGALLLYTSVFVRCFEPTSLTCLLEPWLRELGFSIFYGSIMIKLYRILTEFQTRKAHRVCLRDKDQMVYLLAIVLIVVGYMSAWTALMVDGFFLGQQQPHQVHQLELPKELSVLDGGADEPTGSEPTHKGKPFHAAQSNWQQTESKYSDLWQEASSILNYSATDTFVASATSGQSGRLLEGALTVAERLPEQLKIFVKRLNSFSDLFSGLLEADQQYDDSSDSLTYSLRCRKLTWDYVTEISEMGLLFFGIYLVYKLRNASSEVYKEKLVLSAAIFIELFISALAYAIRHALWNQLSSERLLALYCLRCHLTVTLTLALIFGPKLWTIGKSRPTFFSSSASRATNSSMRHRCHITCELHDHHLNDAMRLHQAMLSNSALDIGSINLADMDPDEIQAELKRVYAQLEVLKTKVMRRDNPHISKRRGGRKQGHRKFSLQAFHAKHIASAVSGSHHQNSSQTSTETGHSLESGNQANNNNNTSEQMTGKKLSVLLEHEPAGSFDATQRDRQKVRMINPRQSDQQRQLPAAGNLSQQHESGRPNQRSQRDSSGHKKRPVAPDPVSGSSICFDDDTLFLNDSSPSENVIHPE